jgi:signal transduction histidine kinase
VNPKWKVSINSLILIIIAAVAIILSAFSYQYFAVASQEIVKIASEEIRLNAEIQAYDFSKILENRLESMTVLLQTLADSPAIQNNEFERAKVIINFRENYTSDLTDFYMWLDREGKIVWISNMNSTAYQKYEGFDLSYRTYFTMPKKYSTAYYSSLIESNDKVPRLYISYPILSKQGSEYNNSNSTRMERFKGVVVTAIRMDTLGTLLKNQLFPHFNSTMGLLDDNGVLLYSDNQAYVGRNIFGKNFLSSPYLALSPNSQVSLPKILKTSLQNNTSCTTDIIVQGETNTLVCEPVIAEGKHFLTLFITAPHILAANVISAIEQQRNFSIFAIVIIGVIAIAIAYLVLIWNKRLQKIVNSRTEQLTKTNESLIKSSQKLEVANKRLEINDKMQREFINVAAHELRTPIQPILGLSEILQTKVKDNEHRGFIDVISRNAKRLHRLTEDILDITKIESQILNLHKEKLNINEVIADIINDAKSQIQIHNPDKLQIVFSEPKEPVFIEADKIRLYQIITNLLNNAIKFTPEGIVSVDTYINDNNEAVVRVKDNGIGIHPEILPRLFTKFATRSDVGTGVGLFISKSIVEAHGGKIWAENNPDGRGATFYFSLPVAPPN